MNAGQEPETQTQCSRTGMPFEGMLAVAAMGDPRDPATWSGTPANVVAALERRGLEIVGVSTKISSRLREAMYFTRYQARSSWTHVPAGKLVQRVRLLVTSELRSDYHWDEPARVYRSRELLETLRNAGCGRVLHMASLSLPVQQAASSPSHYLYCDNTWNTLQRSPDPAWRFSSDNYRRAADIERQSFKYVRHFFTTGDYVKADLIEHYGIDPTRITNVGTGRGGIAPFTGAKSYEDGYILFCAKNRFEEKGGHLLLEAFRWAYRRNNRLRLVLVGRDSYAKYVKDIPGAEGYGSVPWGQLQALFHGASLFAMPATNEPWGLVYLEALASRTPILGLRRNAMRELTGDGRYGFMVDDPAPSAVGAAILDALADPDRLSRMGREGQEFCITTYSWDRVAAEIVRTIGSEARP